VVSRRSARFRINGDLVPRDAWRAVRSRASKDVCITLHMPLRGPGSGGGGSSGKQTAALVATIAVLLVAAAVSGGGTAALIPGVLAAGWGASVAGAAIGTGGEMLVADVFPRPRLAG
jgi:hypothetical protein